MAPTPMPGAKARSVIFGDHEVRAVYVHPDHIRQGVGTSLAWMVLKDGVVEFGAPLFGVTEADLKVTFLRVLLQYRAGIFLFNLVPWVVLKIMAGTIATR